MHDNSISSNNYSRDSKRPTIGLLSVDFWLAQGREIWTGAVDAAREENVNLIYLAGNELESQGTIVDSQANANRIFELAHSTKIDGLIIWAGSIGNYVSYEKMQEFVQAFSSKPIICVGMKFDGIAGLGANDANGVKSLVSHLIEYHGHRRIAFIKGPKTHQGCEVRFNAYKEALKEHNIEFDPDLATRNFPSWEYIGNFYQAYLDGKEEVKIDPKIQNKSLWLNYALNPDPNDFLYDLWKKHLIPGRDYGAFIGATDVITVVAMRQLKALGVSIPEHVAAVGTDGSEEAKKITDIPLTSLSLMLYENGYKAVKQMKAKIMNQQDLVDTYFNSDMNIKRSCGCYSSAINQLDVPQKQSEAKKSEDIIHKINSHFNEDERNQYPGWTSRLLEAFETSLKENKQDPFLSSLSLLISIKTSDQDITYCQKIISHLYSDLVIGFDEQKRKHAEMLLQKARILLHDLEKQRLHYLELKKLGQLELLLSISQTLITKLDLNDLMDALYQMLPKISINTCYLSLYEKNDPKKLRLILAFQENKRISLPEKGLVYPAESIIPDQLSIREQKYPQVVEALYFQDTHLGIMVLEPDPKTQPSFLPILRSQVSSAMKGSLLMDQIKENSIQISEKNAELSRKQNILDSFMTNVPSSIYFKDLYSKFISVNPSFAKLYGFKNPEEAIGLSDYDLVPHDLAKAKHDMELEIIRSGKPKLAFKEPGKEGKWMLSTKMPLFDELGRIIGTFGISQDITELNTAQESLKRQAADLEKANKEIQLLNQDLKNENLQIRAEMEMAKVIQTSLLPKNFLKIHPDFEIAAGMYPAEEIGGDYYDILLDSKENLWISIGDVSGHGVTPGLIMMMTQAIHNSIVGNYDESAKTSVVKTNKVLYKNVHSRLDEIHYMTFSNFKYLGQGSFQFAGAHLDIIIYRNKTKSCEIIPTSGGWLNVFPDIDYCTLNSELNLSQDDMMVLYTDGIVEARALDKTFFGKERLCHLIEKNSHLDVEEIRKIILESAIEWCRNEDRDDMSLVIIKRVN